MVFVGLRWFRWGWGGGVGGGGGDGGGGLGWESKPKTLVWILFSDSGLLGFQLIPIAGRREKHRRSFRV